MDTSLWIEEAAAVPLPAGRLPESADVVIIGGGVAGICTALHLAEQGAAPLVLEAGRVAGRASGRNDGQVLLGLGEHYNRIVGQFGAERARLLWGFIRDNNAGFRARLRDLGVDTGLVEAGGLRLAETGHELEELQEAAGLLAAEGIEHQLLDAAQVRAELPSQGFFGGLRLPGESLIQPAAAVRKLACAAIAAGATIVEDQAVTAIQGAAGDFELLCASQKVKASLLVHCTSGLAPGLDPSGFLAAQLFPFRGQITATDPLDEDLAARFPDYAMSSNFCYEYFRMHARRFMLGGMRWAVKGEENGVVDDRNTNPEVHDKLMGYVRSHFPELAGVAFPHTWTGIMCGTQDGLPLLGAIPGQGGSFCNLGYNGYGLSFAWLAGQVLSEQILEGRSTHPAAALFAPRRLLG